MSFPKSELNFTLNNAFSFRLDKSQRAHILSPWLTRVSWIF